MTIQKICDYCFHLQTGGDQITWTLQSNYHDAKDHHFCNIDCLSKWVLVETKADFIGKVAEGELP